MQTELLQELFNQEKTHWWYIAKKNLLMRYIKVCNKDVLVLGAGGGLLCCQMRDQGARVIAVDISPLACEHMHSKYGIQAVEHDLNNGLPDLGRCFDIIIASDILEHLKFDTAVVDDLSRYLKPGGQFIVTVPAFENLWSYWDEKNWHYRRYTIKTMRGLLKRSPSLHIEKISYFHCILYAAVWLRRKCFKPSQQLSDFKSSSGTVFNAVFASYCAIECRMLKWLNLPFGVSIFVNAINKPIH